MSQDSQDFAALRRLLALKRHEQPPPGYFNNFSSQVIARLKSGEQAEEGVLGRLFWEAPWLQRLWAAIETKPIMAGAFGAAVCALLIAGVIYSENTDVQPVATDPTTTATASIADLSSPADRPVLRPVAFSDRGAMSDPMAPAASSPGIFGLVPKPTAEPAAHTLNLSWPGAN